MAGDRVSLRQEGNVCELEIRGLAMVDAGEYSCVCGQERTSAMLTVRGKDHVCPRGPMSWCCILLLCHHHLPVRLRGHMCVSSCVPLGTPSFHLLVKYLFWCLCPGLCLPFLDCFLTHSVLHSLIHVVALGSLCGACGCLVLDTESSRQPGVLLILGSPQPCPPSSQRA